MDSSSGHNRTKPSQEDEDDPVTVMIRRTGCLQEHYAVQECMADKQDWRECQQEVEDFKKCVNKYHKAMMKKP